MIKAVAAVVESWFVTCPYCWCRLELIGKPDGQLKECGYCGLVFMPVLP